MSQRIEQKKNRLNLEIVASQRHKAELLELIRITPDFFYQLLAHIDSQKVQTFLEKEEKYRSRKQAIQKMRDEIHQEEMKQREDVLRGLNLPENLRRACVQSDCSACLFEHEWKEIMMLACGHVLHEKCLKQLRKNECPMCKREIGRTMNTSGGIFSTYRFGSDDY